MRVTKSAFPLKLIPVLPSKNRLRDTCRAAFYEDSSITALIYQHTSQHAIPKEVFLMLYAAFPSPSRESCTEVLDSQLSVLKTFQYSTYAH
jgi:hypothetical protein